MKIPFADAVSATNAVVFDASNAPALVTVTTDTRLLQPGDTFLALCGERFNGHDFLAEAKSKGAAAFIISDASTRIAGVPTLIVTDTLAAYMALAGEARRRFRGRVLAITGSAGKTTTKFFSAQLLATTYGDRVLASPANENNEIGVSKLLLNATNDQDVLVVEMGARHFGDISTLTQIARPDVAILTNIGEAHLEIMGSRERLETTKWAIFETGADAVINERDEASRNRAPLLGKPAHWFYATGAGQSVPPRARITALLGRDWFIHRFDGVVHERAVNVTVPGDHNRENLAAAAAAALALDADFCAVADAMESIELPKGRYEAIELDGIRLIYDAYNANASGTIAALDAFAGEPAKRRIALLSSMAELGGEAAELHRRVGAHAAEINVDVALFGGDFADELALGARSAGLSSERIIRFASNAEAAEWLRKNACEGDAVLLKGSRKYKLEEIVEELRG